MTDPLTAHAASRDSTFSPDWHEKEDEDEEDDEEEEEEGTYMLNRYFGCQSSVAHRLGTLK